jgi:thioredoxin-related protein
MKPIFTVLLVVFSAAFFTACGSSESESDSNTTDTANYIEYSEQAVSSTPGNKILFFHAPWCSQCVALEEDIVSSGVPEGTTIMKVDYDSNQELRQKYGVTIQTTLVLVDDQGDKIDSYVAYEEPTLNSVQSALLSE